MKKRNFKSLKTHFPQHDKTSSNQSEVVVLHFSTVQRDVEILLVALIAKKSSCWNRPSESSCAETGFEGEDNNNTKKTLTCTYWNVQDIYRFRFEI